MKNQIISNGYQAKSVTVDYNNKIINDKSIVEYI